MALVLSGFSLVVAAPAAADTTTVVVTGNDIRPNEATYPGWHEGYANAERAFFVDAAGLHVGVDEHSQVLYGIPGSQGLSIAELADLVTTARLTTTQGSATFQVPLFFGAGATQSFTTLRSEPLSAGEHSFAADDTWVTSGAIGSIAAGSEDSLLDLVTAAGNQGGLRLLGFGVQSDGSPLGSEAIVTSLTWDGTEYAFGPFVPPAPGEQVTVRDVDLMSPPESTTNYTSWHQGNGSVDSSTVGADGMHVGNSTTSAVVIKGIDPGMDVTQTELQTLVTSASVDVTSGSVTYQVPVFVNGVFMTLLSAPVSDAHNAFTLDSVWGTTKSFGPYTAYPGEPAWAGSLAELLDNAFAEGAVQVIGFGVQADSSTAAVVPSLVWDGTEYLFEQPAVDTTECTPTAGPVATNQDSEGWTFNETRSKGHNVFTEDGLHVWTESNDSLSKAAGYKAVDFPLSEVGAEPVINLINTSGVLPSLQLGISLDGDGEWDGYLVNEGDLYGHGMWWTNKSGWGVAPGLGYPSLGTINDYLLFHPDAQVISIGYSLGSGVQGEATIASIDVGCVSYGFTSDDDYGTPTEVEVDDSQIVPIEDHVGWGDGYGHTPRSYSTQADGAHIGSGYRTQLINNFATPLTTTGLESLITSASVNVVDGDIVTYQIAILYGDLDTFTTLRSEYLPTGENNFSVSDVWASTKPFTLNDGSDLGIPYQGAGGGGYRLPVADMVAFLNAQGNVRVLGVGVQSNDPAVIQDVVFNGTKHVFVPTEAAGTTNAVVVPEAEIELSEPGNYLDWHEGYDNDTKSFSVDVNGLHLGDPSHSQILKGLETPVDGEDLYGILTSQAGVTVESGSVTYQVAVEFGATGWSTLRSGGLAAGDHTFSLSDDWMSSKAIGATIAANTAYPLGEILDAMNAEGDAQAIGFGVQADAAALVSSIVWGDTEYTFVPSITAGTPTISGTAKVGEALTADAEEATWTPASGLDFAYQWQANGAPIDGATSSTYVLTANELGATITVAVTGSKAGYASALGTSLGTAPVLNDHIVVDRISGLDRYATAVEVSKKWESASIVYLATGTGYADALSAGPAAAHNDAPLLLTTPKSLPTGVLAELNRLQPSEIVIVGGTGAVSGAVEAALENLSFNPDVRRVSGLDRYATSRALATDTWGGSSVETAYLATGVNFPDALSASPAAAHFDGPVVLVPGTSSSVGAATLTLLNALDVDKIKIAGGTGVISAAIEAQMKTVFGSSYVTRNGAANRYLTSVAINADEFSSAATVYLATGTGFADALAGAALAGSEGAPLFISQPTCVPQAVKDAIDALDPVNLVLFGGTGALSTAVEDLTVCQ